MRYSIPEVNMENLRKKMTRIQNKCRKYGCDFRFEVVGEEFRELDEMTSIKCFIVEAEGIAVINDWQFVASLEHTEHGNIINKAIEIEVPERYYTTAPICEHCNTNHMRKYTYIVHNVKTDEFKQVGTACLKDFTYGMSATAVASYEDALHDVEEAQGYNFHGFAGGEMMYRQQEYLQFVIECVNKFGYAKRGEENATVDRVHRYMTALFKECSSKKDFEWRERQIAEMEMHNFQWDTESNRETAKKALEWALKQEANSNYMQNLLVVCKQSRVAEHNVGILASLIPVYYKAVERELKLAAQKAEEAKSEWQGKVGERLTVIIKDEDWRVVTSWETQWGWTGIYKMVDANGNIYTWKTSGGIEGRECHAVEIRGTVKAHNEFRGVKQTELTRCKVTNIVYEAICGKEKADRFRKMGKAYGYEVR